jgi:TonB family protein
MRIRNIGAFVGMALAVGLAAVQPGVSHGYFTLEAAQQMPPRDARPGEPRPATKQELDLQKTLSTSPADTQALLELAKLQESRGAAAEAESTLLKIRQLDPSDAGTYRALAEVYRRWGQFDRAIESLQRAASLQPADPAAQHLVATYCFEMTRSQSVTAAEKAMYIQRGLAAEQRALDANPDYVEALVYKNLLLRTQANMEPDTAKQQALLAEADALRNRAMQLQKDLPAQPRTPGQAAPPPPPPPPLPPASFGQIEQAYATTSYSVDGSATRPRKIKDVPPVYPPIAISAGVRGVVVVEATVDPKGRVTDARIVQSVRMLDQSAIDAVKQWEFEPAPDNNSPVQRMITVTVTFTPPQ